MLESVDPEELRVADLPLWDDQGAWYAALRSSSDANDTYAVVLGVTALVSTRPATEQRQTVYLRFTWSCEVSLWSRAKGEAKAKQWFKHTCSTKSVAVEGRVCLWMLPR